MPSIMFHELIGYRFAKKHKEYDTQLFYLGLMVPDAVNAYGFASKEARWRTHCRDQNLDKWKENIISFYFENKLNYNKKYLIGYLIHVLTDILCDKIYQNRLYPDLLKNGYDYNSAYGYYEESIKKFENSNLNLEWWKYVKRNFDNAERIPINDISEKMIQDWIKYVIDQYDNRHYEQEGYITDTFVEMVLEELEKDIEKLI